MRNRVLSRTSVLAVAIWCSTPAYAQSGVDTVAGRGAAEPPASEEASSQLTDILVTAQRRQERLQDVPIAVTAVTGEDLKASGIQSLDNLRVAVPGLSVRNAGVASRPYLRGVGTAVGSPLGEPPIALYVDGVYVARAPSIFTFNNVANVEVLKGPQGTLFGRNATGGLIQVTTLDPTHETTGSFEIGYGNYETVRGNAYLSTGLSDDLAWDIAFNGAYQGDGFGRNVATGSDVYRVDRDIGIRSKILFTPGSDTRIVLSADYSNQKNSLANLNRFVPGSYLSPGVLAPIPGDNPYDVNLDHDPLAAFEVIGGSLSMSHDLGRISLKSITAYRYSDGRFYLDLDYLPSRDAFGDSVNTDRQFTQEFQVQSDGSGAFTWTVGAFYFKARSDENSDSALNPAFFALSDGRYRAESIAGYGQFAYALTPATHLTLGARYTHERREIDASTSVNGGPPILDQRATSVNRPSFRISLDHKLNPDVMIYASFNTGFKSGGYSLASSPSYLPETLTAYEAGVKSELFGRRVRFNVSAFYYDYQDVQVQILTPRSVLTNGAEAELYGVDIDLNAKVTDRLSVNGAIELLHARYQTFNSAPIGGPLGGEGVQPGSAAGNYLPYAPDVAANLGINHSAPLGGGMLSTTLLGYYVSRQYAQPDNIVSQDPYVTLNASVTWESADGFSIRAWMENITDELVMQNSTNSAPTGRQAISYQAPRTYGITLGYHF